MCRNIHYSSEIWRKTEIPFLSPLCHCMKSYFITENLYHIACENRSFDKADWLQNFDILYFRVFKREGNRSSWNLLLDLLHNEYLHFSPQGKKINFLLKLWHIQLATDVTESKQMVIRHILRWVSIFTHCRNSITGRKHKNQTSRRPSKPSSILFNE